MIWRPWLIALGLLSRIPIPWHDPNPTPIEMGRSVLYYPLVGLLLGLLLALFTWMLPNTLDTGVKAALTLIVWVGLTGGLHLDGLADTADAWIGAMGDRQRALAIMKDPHCGPAAITTIVLILLLKFTALQAVINNHASDLLILPLLLGRAGILALFLRLPYLRPNGMGALAAAHLPRGLAMTVLIFGAIGVVGYWQLLGMKILAVWGGMWYFLYLAIARRLGGMTGDTAGAVCEIMETTLLTALTVSER